MPISLHKAFKISVVPSFHLREQQMLDAFFKIGALVFGRLIRLRILRRLL